MNLHVGRSQLEQIIADLSSGVVLLDPDGSIVQANHAALAMHGCDRLEELGTTAAAYRKRFELRYRNHHLLGARQYPFARLLAGERFGDITVEVTRRDDADFRRMHQLRGLPITNASGKSESLALIGKDVTDEVNAEERFERTFAANPAPALICRIADTRYIKVNQGFVDMTGFAREEVIDRRFRELDVLREAEHRDDALAALHEHRTISQQEATLKVHGGAEKFVIVAGQPIDLDDEACILFTFNDLDGRKLAEASLRQSEERFSKAFRLAPVPMLVCTRREWQVMEVNDAFAAMVRSAPADSVGKTLSDLGFPTGAKVMRELCASPGPSLRNLDFQLHLQPGVAIDCRLSTEPVTIHNQECVLCVVPDVTEYKRSEQDLMTAIETVMKDTSWFSRTVMEKLAQIRRPGGGADGELGGLTPRERQVLERMCKGQTDAEIASDLKLARNTVRNHVASLYDKLGVNRRSAAVVWGRERGLAAY